MTDLEKYERNELLDINTLSETSAVIFNRFSIFFNKPLKNLDIPGAKAFKVEDKVSVERNLFAYVADLTYLPRASNTLLLKNSQIKGLLPYITSSFFSIDNYTYFAVIYEKPLGGKVFPNIDAEVEPINEFDFIKTYAVPLINTLKALTEKGICHRAIRPDNLFFMDGEKTEVVLGDFITSPAAFYQPAVFETIESMQCTPLGRSAGTIKNDIYALGVTFLFLLLGENPHKKLSDKELLQQKLFKGSYATLVGGVKIPLSIMELLRGVLLDNEANRWGIDSLDLWTSGRRLTPLQYKSSESAQRPIFFNGRDYYEKRSLSQAIIDKPEEGFKLVSEKTFIDWVKRGLNDEKLSKRIENCITFYSNISKEGNLIKYIVCAKVALMLDEKAPIRYKNFSFFPESLSDLIYYGFKQNKGLDVIAEVLKHNLIEDWFERAGESSHLRNKYLTIKTIAANKNLGMGLERCLYDLNNTAPCISPIFINDVAYELKQVLECLENIAIKMKKKYPMDNHIAAFISSKLDKKAAGQLDALNSKNTILATAGLINVYSLLQLRYGPKKLPNLTCWLGYFVDPVIESYYSKNRRDRIKRALPGVIKSGHIYELNSLVDHIDERTKDKLGYDKAIKDLNAVSKSLAIFSRGDKERKEMATYFGHQIASIIGTGCAMFTMMFLLLSKLL